MKPFTAVLVSGLFVGLALPSTNAESADVPIIQSQQKDDFHSTPAVQPVDNPRVLPDGKLARQKLKWRADLRSNPKPKKGCFSVTFPDTVWHEVACTTAPNVPYHGHRLGSGSYVVGGSAVGDFSAQAPSSFISSAEGWFEKVSDGINETGQNYGMGPQVNNAYSLQLR